MRIEVTVDHIERGTPGTFCTCPVALAIRDATGDATWGSGEAHAFRLRRGAGYYDEFALPDSAQRFIVSFDRRQPVAPFSFDLDIPPTPSEAA